MEPPLKAPFVRADVRAFLDAANGRPRPPISAETIASIRQAGAQGMAALEVPVGELAVDRSFAMPGPASEIPLRLFDARHARDPGPLVVFYHGGGFVSGSVDTHAPICAEIARRLDLPVISVGYRLAPEDPWPAGPDDAEAAARWIADHGPTFDRGVSSLILCGDSAGATLALVTALALRDRPAAAPVALQIALYPLADIDGQWEYPSCKAYADGYVLSSMALRFYQDAYRPEPGHWRGAPLAVDLQGMPPLLLVTAALDPLRDQGRAYAAKAIDAGVTTSYLEIEGTIHGFASCRRALPSAEADLQKVLAYADAMIRASPAERA